MSDKWHKVALIKRSKAGSQYLSFGNPQDKYQPVNVKVVVEDLNGKVLTEELNPVMFIQDPRKRKGITEDQAGKIPDFIRAEVSLAPAKKE